MNPNKLKCNFKKSGQPKGVNWIIKENRNRTEIEKNTKHWIFTQMQEYLFKGSFECSCATVFTVAQEVPAMTNYLNLVVDSWEHLCYISERTAKCAVCSKTLKNLEFAGKWTRERMWESYEWTHQTRKQTDKQWAEGQPNCARNVTGSRCCTVTPAHMLLGRLQVSQPPPLFTHGCEGSLKETRLILWGGGG